MIELKKTIWTDADTEPPKNFIWKQGDEYKEYNEKDGWVKSENIDTPKEEFPYEWVKLDDIQFTSTSAAYDGEKAVSIEGSYTYVIFKCGNKNFAFTNDDSFFLDDYELSYTRKSNESYITYTGEEGVTLNFKNIIFIK